MTHIDLLPSDASASAEDTRASVRHLIQTSLRRAFPLSATGKGEEERFRRLLEALAQRISGDRQEVARAQPQQEATWDDWVLVALLVGTALGGLAAVIGGAYGISLLVALLP